MVQIKKQNHADHFTDSQIVSLVAFSHIPKQSSRNFSQIILVVVLLRFVLAKRFYFQEIISKGFSNMNFFKNVFKNSLERFSWNSRNFFRILEDSTMNSSMYSTCGCLRFFWVSCFFLFHSMNYFLNEFLQSLILNIVQ